MDEAGCAVLTLLCISAPVAFYVYARLQSESEARRANRDRAAKITELLEYISQAPHNRQRALDALLVHFREGPIGFLPELTGSERWFERVSPVLTSLLADPNEATIVGWYFTCFTFLRGQQTAVLKWLYEIVTTNTAIRHETLRSVIERALLPGGSVEADWFYRRLLELLREGRIDPAFRTLVLHAGRIRYGCGRPDRHLTVDEEQAIANDIAMALP